MKLILVFLFLFSCWILLLNPALGNLYDTPRYICIGYSIAQGNGYRLIYDIDNPPCFYNNYIFPYLISPLIKFFGINLYILKVFILFLSLGVVIAFYSWLNAELGRGESLYVSILFLCSPLFIYFSDKILTEIPFLFFILMSFYFFAKWIKTKNNFYLFLISIAAYLSIFTRTAGIALLFALSISSLLKKKKTLFIICLLILIGAIITISIIQSNLENPVKLYHIKYFLAKNTFEPDAGVIGFKDILQRIQNNLYFYSFNIGNETINFPSKPKAGAIITLLIVVFGIIKLKSKTKLFQLSFLIIYIFLFIIWPWQDIRFIIPVLFLFIFYFYIGLKNLTLKLPFLAKKIIFASILLLMLYAGANKLLNKINLESQLSAQMQEFINICAWVSSNTDNNAVIFSSHPDFAYLLTFRKGAFLIYTENLDEISEYLKTKKVTHIIADRFNIEMKKYIYPWIVKEQSNLNVLRVDGKTTLLKLN